MINDATSIPSSISNTLVSFDCPTLSPADISTAADAEAVAAEALKKNEIGQSENVSGREVADGRRSRDDWHCGNGSLAGKRA